MTQTPATTAGRPVSVDPAAVARCQAEGMTQAETAAALNISLSSARKHWKKGKPGNHTGSTYAEQIAAQVAEGKTDREIADALGVAVSTVNRQRRRLKA